MTRTIEGSLIASGLKFAIIAARFNSFIVDHLVRGATSTIVAHGGAESDITVVKVPGSYEIPLVSKKLALSKRYDAIIALGAVVRGATLHYDLVCSETASGISRVSLEHSVPITFGVLTTDNMEQAIERAGGKAGNKGCEAALAAIEMVNLLRKIEGEK